MPYNKLADLPPTVRKMPEAKQRQWMAVFNKAKKSGKAEADCFKIAYGAVKMSEVPDMRRRMLSDNIQIQPDGMLKIQVLEPCDFEHPLFGRIQKGIENFQNFIANFKKLGQKDRIPLDYDHGSAHPNPASKDQILAAGWVQDVVVEETEHGPGLFVLAEPTPAAKNHVQNKELRYASLEWEDREDGENIIKAVALTNRPWIKTMAPIMALSESAQAVLDDITTADLAFEAAGDDETNPNPNEGDKNMKGIAKALGLAEDATEEQILAKLAENSKAVETLTTENKTLSEKIPGKDAKVLTLSEFTTLQAQAADGSNAMKRLNEKERDEFLDKAIVVEKRLLPSQRKALSELWDSGETGKKQVKALVEASPKGAAAVKLNDQEIGSAEGGGDPTNPRFVVAQRAKELMTKNPKLSETKAREMVFNADRDLYDAYRNQVAIKEK